MDFGDILDEWDRRAKTSGRPARFEPAYHKDAETVSPGERRRRLLRKKPDAAVDLHGLTRDEAWAALDDFFRDARIRGFEKLLVIHGKGSHSSGEAILKRIAREFIERCPFAGESGYSSPASGGTGSTWVLLK
jgi:DNA-nicking Smr family endonuclease